MPFGPWPVETAQIARKYGLDPYLFAGLIQQESGWNPNAIGDHGHSVGLGQFNTGGALQDWNISRERYLSLSPIEQMDLAAAQLAAKTRKAGGDPIEGLRLYNGGGDPNYVSHVLGQIKSSSGLSARSVLARQPKPKLQAATMLDFTIQPPPTPQPQPVLQGATDLSAFLGPPMMENRPLDPVQQIMNNPLTHIGLGILATPTGQGSWLQGVARGTLAGMQSFQAQQRLEAEIEDTLEKQRQRAYRKQMEDMRLRIAATMPGLSDLERNLLITDPNAFGQIYAQKLQQQQQQRQNEAMSRMFGGGQPATDAPAAGMVPQEAVSPAPFTPMTYEAPRAIQTGPTPAELAGAGYPNEAISLYGQNRQIEAQRQRDIEAEQRRVAEENRKVLREKDEKYFEQSSKLRAEFENRPEVQEWASVQRSLNVVPELYKAAQTENSKVADIALITAVGNAQDPKSVVMEGERIAIQKSGGLVDEIKGYINYFNNNGRLEKGMREDLVKTVQRFGQAQAKAARARQEQYIKQAKRYRFDPVDVVGDPIESPAVGYGLDLTPTPPPGYRTEVGTDGVIRAIPIETETTGGF